MSAANTEAVTRRVIASATSAPGTGLNRWTMIGPPCVGLGTSRMLTFTQITRPVLVRS